MRFSSTRFSVIAAAVALATLPAGAFAGQGSGQQGGQVTTSVDVQLTVLALCKSVSVSGNQIHFTATPTTQPVTAQFNVSYDCAANALPSLAFLSQNGCKLLADDKNNSQGVPYQILGQWGNQLACSPGDLQSHFQPISSSPTTFTLKTAPLLQTDPHVYPAGTYGDTVIATLDF